MLIFRPYKILIAYNSPFAHKAIEAEDKIGIMLPCNEIIQELKDGVEVAAINPIASMMSVNNKQLEEVASIIQNNLGT